MITDERRHRADVLDVARLSFGCELPEALGTARRFRIAALTLRYHPSSSSPSSVSFVTSLLSRSKKASSAPFLIFFTSPGTYFFAVIAGAPSRALAGVSRQNTECV